jgi:hypothetical protein
MLTGELAFRSDLFDQLVLEFTCIGMEGLYL